MLTEAKILAVMLSLAPAGKSPYSVVAVPECGRDQAHPACELKPVCDEQYTLRCAPPHWDRARGAFVRQENAEEARARYATIAAAIVSVARRATKPSAEGQPAVWPWGESALGDALGTIAFHESGFRRDVHEGVGDEALGDCSFTNKATGTPLTQPAAAALSKSGGHVRRTCRSVCLAQIQTGGLDGEKWGVVGRDLVGLSQDATERCLMASARMLAAARGRCSRWQSTSGWFLPAIVGYGQGSGCESSAKWATDRLRTFEKFGRGRALEPAPGATAGL